MPNPTPTPPRWHRAARALAVAFALAYASSVAPWATPTAAAAHQDPAFPKSVYAKYIHQEGGQTLRALFDQELALAKKKKKEVVVFFTADWCSPCQAFKELLVESKQVQKAAKAAHILFIDVDEWRGPAHELIPTVVPDKLPTLCRVDARGGLVKRAFGTELGLISEPDTAKNLALLIQGKDLVEPSYAKDPELTRKLSVASAMRAKARTEGWKAVSVEVEERPASAQGLWTLDITLRNADSRRRWFVLPASLDKPLTETPQANGWQELRFQEHVRASYYKIGGEPGLIVIPVGGNGWIDLKGWTIPGRADATALEVWEIDNPTLAGMALEFQKKLPHELALEHANRFEPVQQHPGATTFTFKVAHKRSAALE